MERMIALPLS
jgi:hypothetical protein